MAPYRRPLAIALTAVAGALVAGALAAGLWGGSDGGLVVLGKVRGHLVAMGWGALVALIAAALTGLRQPMARIALAVAPAVLGVPVLLIGTLGALLSDEPKRTQDLAAPGNEGRRLVVERSYAMIDPVWDVYVHEGDGLLERRWAVGTFNGDAPANALGEAVWTGPDTIRMAIGDGTVHEVTLAPGGRPDRTVSAGW
ncbi:hypothetical protein [Streptomyces sp. NPDC092307]|uniref:hypothetical protein n=1 Tax=Streptomyces sp. NPDC092307 TaxID=3366013 RepID=UPI00382DCFD6